MSWIFSWEFWKIFWTTVVAVEAVGVLALIWWTVRNW